MSHLTVRFQDDYSPANKYPFLVYVPRGFGGPKGNVGNAQEIAGRRGGVVASLPLFKSSVDRNEPSGELVVGFQDHATLSHVYAVMLGRLFELVPNIDRENSAMVGFSNGAISIAVLVSSHDEFVLTHLRNFCLIDHGMFHLTDLQKRHTRGSKFLVLAGDNEADVGRELKIRGGQLLRDSWRLLGVDVSFQIMKDTGHEFPKRHMDIVGRWLRNESTIELPPGTDSALPRH